MHKVCIRCILLDLDIYKNLFSSIVFQLYGLGKLKKHQIHNFLNFQYCLLNF